MSQNTNFEQRKAVINRLAAQAKLPEIARALGLHVVSGGSIPRALCPFHDDEHPSLSLYPSSRGARPRYHCFACGANGDVFDLVKKRLNTDFRGALDWLSTHEHVSVPVVTSSKRRGEIVARLQGLELGFDIYRKQTEEESAILARWAGERQFQIDLLQRAEVFAALPPKIAAHVGASDREEIDSLETAGLLRRGSDTMRGGSPLLPLELPPLDFFYSPRIIFTIRDDRGVVTGFGGRATESDTPKYLFSPGFPRGSTLYRWDKFRGSRRANETAGSANHVFVVEGLMDALRLESLGLHAVALLSSNLTVGQLKLLTDYADELDREDSQLVVHLLLDLDEAGHRGEVSATVKLLEAAVSAPGLLVDVIAPSLAADESHLHDPDELFRDVQNGEEVLKKLAGWSVSPMSVLLAKALEVAPAELESTWVRLPDSQRLRAFRDVERRLDRSVWIGVLDRVAPFETHLGEATAPSPWQEPLTAFLRAASLQASLPMAPLSAPDRDDDARLIRAMQIAEASTQRREFPIDEGSWDRLKAALDTTVAHLRDLLKSNENLERSDADKMIAVEVPKPDGGFRLKALPSPEILTLQQYVLDELLRDYSDCPRFQRLIPGVRFSTAAGWKVETTAEEQFLPHNGETVSFAYMLGMEVIEQRAAPLRSGMFRSYRDCWRDFIAHIDGRIVDFPPGKFHVARLDIRGFYDNVPRSAVIAVLLPCVSDALTELADSTEDQARAGMCARIFLPEATNPQDRAEALVDWLCEQSFNYEFENPGTGIPQRRGYGLPQGPDLSAYLANISLFPLDRTLSKLVAQLDESASKEAGKPARGGVYARYVDDMVIIARTAHDLARLRASVEKELALLGMELNFKTDALPVMDAADVRNWLTDRRGAGLGVSSPSDGPPVNAPLALTEPLAEAGETNRSDSLVILYDGSLDDPDLPIEYLEDTIAAVQRAAELRHGDQVTCARHLWRCVLKRVLTATPETAANAMRGLWKRDIQPPPFPDEATQVNANVADLLAWLDGIERFLGSRTDRSPAFSERKHRELADARERMALLVHQGLCEFLLEGFLPVAARARFLHMIELKALAIRFAATCVSTPPTIGAAALPKSMRSQAKARLLISIAEVEGSTEILDRADFRAPSVSLGILFHESIARLRIADNRPQETRDPLTQSTSLDPLMPLMASMADQRRLGSRFRLARILDLWMPNTNPAATSEDATIALGTLVNLAPSQVVDLLERRFELKRFALDDLTGIASCILPTPPGINVPGLLGLRDDNHSVLRADFWKKEEKKEERQFLPSDLSWTATEEVEGCPWTRSEASLAHHEYLTPMSESTRDVNTPHWLAMAFRSLAQVAQSSGEFSCPPTALNLLGPAVGNQTVAGKWEVLGFCSPTSRLVSQAFRRHGGGLTLEPVLAQHDDLWRIGTALADFLGYAETSRSLGSQHLSARAIVTEPQNDWAREAMLRFSLYRLRGRGLSTHPLRLNPDTRLPMTVERVLQRLKTFPSDAESVESLANLVATLAEGRAIQARLNAHLDPAIPGSGVAFLAEITRGQLRTDEELAQRLPDADELPSWAPWRRPARALFAVAQRLELLSDADPHRNDDPTLACLSSGVRVLAIEANLRAQALELWSLLDSASRAQFIQFPPSLAEWELDGEALLHALQTGLVERDADERKWQNVAGLFQFLNGATAEGERVRWRLLGGVTPLGWLVVIGSLTGVLTGGWRGSLADLSLLGAAGLVELKTLATKLALCTEEDDDLPWGGLSGVTLAFRAGEMQSLFEVLHLLDRSAKLNVKSHESSRLSIDPSRQGPTEVNSSDGLRQMQRWTISWARLIGESRAGIERILADGNEPRAIFRWSETWRGNRLIGIGVVQPAMKTLAGKAFANQEAMPNKSVVIGSEPAIEIPDAKRDLSIPISEQAADLITSPTETIGPNPDPVTLIKSQAVDSAHPDKEKIRAALNELRTMQEYWWRSRGEKPQSQARVALLQWELDSSYLHPGFELCNEPKRVFNAREPEKWSEPKRAKSCAEGRRRAILEATLKACYRFNVDILLLPEYSTRPETVDWITRELPTLAPGTSVWAGTYRLPPWMAKYPHEQFAPWSAVHEVVLPGGDDRRRPRSKKYPSAAADEVFHPGTHLLEPLFESDTPDVRSYTMELICSEVFLVTCPANIRPLARARRDLLRKFGLGLEGKDLDEMIKRDISPDIMEFAKRTCMNEGLERRRTLLLVPAMTSRSADYTILGQAAYLSSALTTVFCNAVEHHGDGQSCFIGHGSWHEPSSSIRYPALEPYHGERPGIFSLNRGQLGKEEQALVIADIDPLYSSEGKPRPQTLLKPLKLVAHLPLIESWQKRIDGVSGFCRCGRGRHTLDAAVFAPDLLKVLQDGIAEGRKQTTDDPDPGRLYEAMRQLADPPNLCRESDQTAAGWLRRRADAYLAGHAADPNPWPPPVALDWLWVDSNLDEHPSIDAPPYATPPSDEKLRNRK